MRTTFTILAAMTLGFMMVPACGDDDSTEFPTGEWALLERSSIGEIAVLEFTDDGTWTLSGGMTLDELEQVDQGTYSATDDTFTWETDEICKTNGAEQGTYTWSLDDDQLTLTEVDDDCSARVDIASKAAWVHPEDFPES